jgi:hypothetical protein
MDQHLIAELEGPSFISRTVVHRRVDGRCSLRPKGQCGFTGGVRLAELLAGLLQDRSLAKKV